MCVIFYKQKQIDKTKTKSRENSNIIDIKSVTVEPLKMFCKSCRTLRHSKKVFQVIGAGKTSTSPLYSKATKNLFR